MTEETAPPSEDRRSVEAWAEAKQIAPWMLAAARTHAAWPVGAELTEASFDEAVEAVSSLSLR